MKFFPDPIAELRRFFDSVRVAATESRLRRPACGCRFCRLRRERPRDDGEFSEGGQGRALGVGVFGVRPRGRPSRYLEFSRLQADNFLGRLPGGHFVPTIQKMPVPNFIDQLRAVKTVAEIEALVKTTRIPTMRIGSAAEYRKELVAQACAEFFAGKSAYSVRQAVDRSIKQLRKIYRELT